MTVKRTTEPGTCTVWVFGATWGEHSHACGKKVTDKDPDGELCGLHFAAKQRRIKKDEEVRDAQDSYKAYAARAQTASESLGISLSLPVTQYSNGARRVTGDVTIRLTELESLATEVANLREWFQQAQESRQ